MGEDSDSDELNLMSSKIIENVSSESSSHEDHKELFELKVRPLEPQEPMDVLDQGGYRAIWTSLMQNDAFGIQTASHRIRMKEETKQSTRCNIASNYYDKIMFQIDNMKINNSFEENEHITLNRMISRVFTTKSYIDNSTEKWGKEALIYTKSIVGEQCKESLLDVVIFSMLQAARKKRREIYKLIGELTEPVKSDDVPNKKFKCLMLKPFKDNEKNYLRFLNAFLISMESIIQSTECLAPLYEYLAKNTSYEMIRLDLTKFSKNLYYGLIYSNLLVKECLGEIDRSTPPGPVIVKSSYDSSSSDEPEGPSSKSIIYDGIEVHNRLRIEEGDKSQFWMVFMQSNYVKLTSYQITNRKPFSNSDFKALTTDGTTDLYGTRYPQPKQK